MCAQELNIALSCKSRLFCDGLESIIGGLEDFRIQFSATAENGLWDYLESAPQDQILVLEIDCPSRTDLDHIKKIRSIYPHLKILLLSNPPRKDIGIEILDSGISGYMLKACSKDDLIGALRRIMEDKIHICSDITRSLFAGAKNNEKDYALTDREKEVLALLVYNHTNKQIASKLNLSENTVKTHRRNIHNKFGVHNLMGMVRYACRTKLVEFHEDEDCRACTHMN